MLCCACSQGNAVTVPFRLGIELRAMRKLEAQLTQQLGRPPTQAEVVAEVRCRILAIILLNCLQASSALWPAQSPCVLVVRDAKVLA